MIALPLVIEIKTRACFDKKTVLAIFVAYSSQNREESGSSIDYWSSV